MDECVKLICNGVNYLYTESLVTLISANLCENGIKADGGSNKIIGKAYDYQLPSPTDGKMRKIQIPSSKIDTSSLSHIWVWIRVRW